MDLASFCAGLQVSTPSLATTASGVNAASLIRLSDSGMQAFYGRLIGDLLARTEAAQPFPHLPTIIRAMIWDFSARTSGSGDITLWFGCDSPIAAAAPLLSSSLISGREDPNVCVVFQGYYDFRREIQISPIPFDPVDRFEGQREAWRRLRGEGAQLYSIAYSSALSFDVITESFMRLVEVSGPPSLLLLDTFSSVEESALAGFRVSGWQSKTIVDRAFSTEPTGECWRILALRFEEI